MSAVRGHHDIALGNIFGSNLFNLLAVMSVPGIISPLALEREVFYRDYMAMSLLTVTLVAAIAFSLWRGRKEHRQALLSKKIGITLLILYGLYYAVLIPSA
jgi:cation:H+ antiporter